MTLKQAYDDYCDNGFSDLLDDNYQIKKSGVTKIKYV